MSNIGNKTPEIRFKGYTEDWERCKLGEVADFLDTQRKPLEGFTRIGITKAVHFLSKRTAFILFSLKDSNY